MAKASKQKTKVKNIELTEEVIGILQEDADRKRQKLKPYMEFALWDLAIKLNKKYHPEKYSKQ